MNTAMMMIQDLLDPAILSPDADCESALPGAGASGEIAEKFVGEWCVLHTRSRQEKAVSCDLKAMGVQHFLPLVREVRFYGRRKFIVEAPLFPGYVFLNGTIEDAYRVDRTKRIASIIPVCDQATLDWELANLRIALTQDVPLNPYPYLKKGVRVEIRSGPFRGLQGVVEDKCKVNRLILQIEMLGAAVSLEIDGALLDVM